MKQQMPLPAKNADLSALIGDIYDCILRRDHWAVALEKLCLIVGGTAASLNVLSIPDQVPELLVEHGTSPLYSKSYVSTYGRINPLVDAALLHMPQGEVQTLYEQIDVGEYRRSRFYLEWVKPQGWGDWMAGMLVRSTSRLSLLAIARREELGSFDQSEVEFLWMMIPHIERAVVLGRLLDEREARHDGMTVLLDRIKVAALLVAATGTVVHANGAAKTLLGVGTILRETGGVLNAADLPVTKLLAGAFVAAATPAAVTVCSPAGKHVVSVVPPSPESGELAVVLVTVPEADLPLPGWLLLEAYGLTPAELRVLVPLLRSQTLGEIAADLGITHRTVKAHLQSMFRKTGTTRQAELALQMARLLPPISL